jgi:hypothetical protein
VPFATPTEPGLMTQDIFYRSVLFCNVDPKGIVKVASKQARITAVEKPVHIYSYNDAPKTSASAWPIVEDKDAKKSLSSLVFRVVIRFCCWIVVFSVRTDIQPSPDLD